MKSTLLFGFLAIMTMVLSTISVSAQESSKNIYLDTLFAADIQQAADELKFNAFLIAADTIFVSEKINFHGLSAVIICNSLITKGNSITLYPNRKGENTYKDDKRGRIGRKIEIITRSGFKGEFVLPGGEGGKGNKGKEGASGDSTKVGFTDVTSISAGTAGGVGEKGGDGGKGGDVFVKVVEDGTIILLTSIGGKGGDGGDGGDGGITYSRKVSKIIGSPPNQRTIYGPKIYEHKALSGKKGENGKNGREGKHTIKKINYNEFENKLKKFNIVNLQGTDMPIVTLINITLERPDVQRPPNQVTSPNVPIKSN